MKIKIILLLVLIIVIGLTAYRFGNKKNVALEIPPNPKEGIFDCPYIVKNSPYRDYLVDYETVVIGKPQFIENPTNIKTSEPFNKQEFEKGLYKYSSTDKGWTSREFDVDGDGKKETIISANTASNRTPHIAAIVKNGNIIFETEGANVWIEEVLNAKGNGFLLKETVEFTWYPFKKEITRYIYKDGGFLPVYKQLECSISFQ